MVWVWLVLQATHLGQPPPSQIVACTFWRWRRAGNVQWYETSAQTPLIQKKWEEISQHIITAVYRVYISVFFFLIQTLCCEPPAFSLGCPVHCHSPALTLSGCNLQGWARACRTLSECYWEGTRHQYFLQRAAQLGTDLSGANSAERGVPGLPVCCKPRVWKEKETCNYDFCRRIIIFNNLRKW